MLSTISLGSLEEGESVPERAAVLSRVGNEEEGSD